MNRNTKRALALILAVIFVLSLAACGPSNAPVNNAQTEPAGNIAPEQGNTAPEQSNTAPEQGNTAPEQPQQPDDGYVTVASIDELKAAIKPGARIRLKSGTYTADSTIVIDKSDIALTGETDSFADTQLLLSSGESNVLELVSCENVTVSNMTLGHTTQPGCYGNVIHLSSAENVMLENVDLFGCGVYAISEEGECKGLTVNRSTLRDCQAGALFIFTGSSGGRIEFNDCVLTGSGGGMFVQPSLVTEVYLNRCRLGQGESNQLSFADEIMLKDCEVMEPTSYPEYGPWTPTFAVELLKEAPKDIDLLTSRTWLAYIMTPTGLALTDIPLPSPYCDLRTGEALRMAFSFQNDFTGSIYNHSFENEDRFTWDIMQNGDMIIKYGDGKEGYVDFFKVQDEPSGLDQTWVRISLGEYSVWLCLLPEDMDI